MYNNDVVSRTCAKAQKTDHVVVMGLATIRIGNFCLTKQADPVFSKFCIQFLCLSVSQDILSMCTTVQHQNFLDRTLAVLLLLELLC